MIGFAALEEGFIVFYTEAVSQFLICPSAIFAVAFDVESFEVEAFFGGEAFPDEGVEAFGDEVIAGDRYGLIDNFLDLGFVAAFLSRFGEFVGDVDVFNVFVLGQHAQSGSVGGKLVVGVAKVGVFFVFEYQHGVELTFDF